MTEATDMKMRNVGLLVMRVGFGLMIAIAHGWPMMMGGMREWMEKGAAMANLGIQFSPAFWGFMAAFSELVGGLCIMLGIFVRPMSGLIAFTMFVAAISHFSRGEGASGAALAIQFGGVAIGLALIGSGEYSISRLLFDRKKA